MIDIKKLAETAKTTTTVLPSTGTRKPAGVYSAYQIARIVNDTLVAMGRADLRIEPQSMYQYANNGLISGTKKARDFSEAHVNAFVPKFIATLIAKSPKK